MAEPEQVQPCFQSIQYTDLARAERIEGVVVLKTVINRHGRVCTVKVLRGLGYGLDKEASKHLKACVFEPAYSRWTGEPLDVIYTLTVNFRLTN